MDLKIFQGLPSCVCHAMGVDQGSPAFAGCLTPPSPEAYSLATECLFLTSRWRGHAHMSAKGMKDQSGSDFRKLDCYNCGQ